MRGRSTVKSGRAGGAGMSSQAVRGGASYKAGTDLPGGVSRIPPGAAGLEPGLRALGR